VQQDPNSAQKENNINAAFFPTEQSAANTRLIYLFSYELK
jgi:hypothetical protein